MVRPVSTKMHLTNPRSKISVSCQNCAMLNLSLCATRVGICSGAAEHTNKAVKMPESDFLPAFLSLCFQKKPIFGVKDFHLDLNDNIWFSSLSPTRGTSFFFYQKSCAIRAASNNNAAHMWRENLIRNSWLRAREKNLTPNKWSVVVNLLSCQGKDFSVSPTEPSSALFRSVQHPSSQRFGFSLFSSLERTNLTTCTKKVRLFFNNVATLRPEEWNRSLLVCVSVLSNKLGAAPPGSDQACNQLTCNLRIKSSRALLFYSFNFNVQQIKCLLHSFIVLFPRFAPRKGGGGPLKALAPTIIKLERQLK